MTNHFRQPSDASRRPCRRRPSTRILPTARTLALALASLAPGCADGETAVDVTFTQDVDLVFRDLVGGEPAALTVAYDSLRKEAAFVAHEGALTCATVDPSASHLEVAVLDAAGGDDATLGVDVDVARPGDTWVPLATTTDTFRARDVRPFIDTGVTLEPAGVAHLESIALGPSPVYDGLVTVTPDRDVATLTLGLRLVLVLSTDASGCP